MSFDLINDSNKKVHFIGIGGISMSGLAEILLHRGYRVSGSDMKNSPMVEKLKVSGAEVFIGHNESNINGADIIVYTAAISEDNKELLAAKNSGKILMDRAEFLGDLMKGHRYNVAISGTHGKTTTTSMISHIVLEAKVDPTILVGGELDVINGNYRAGNSEYFITEACEYKASFLKFQPYIGLILNIDADHLDFYKDINEIEDTFIKFAKLIPQDGYLIGCYEDGRVRNVLSKVSCKKLTYGLKEGNLVSLNINFDSMGCASFDVFKDSKFIVTLNLKVPGEHNILNALGAVACGLALNIDLKIIKSGIEGYYGTHRRFEKKGIVSGITVIDDYAHHPTEIKATLKAALNYPHKKIFCVFQPHTYSRTISLFKEFSDAFKDADTLILADIYAAREVDTGIVSSAMLGDAIRDKGQHCENFDSFSEIVSYLDKEAKEGDIVLTVGAGDVFKVGELFLSEAAVGNK